MWTGIKSSRYFHGSGYQQNNGLCSKMGRKEADNGSPCQTILARLSPCLIKPG